MIRVLKSLRMAASAFFSCYARNLARFRGEGSGALERAREAPPPAWTTAGPVSLVLFGLFARAGHLDRFAIAGVAPQVVEVVVAAELPGPVEAGVDRLEEEVEGPVLLVH